MAGAPEGSAALFGLAGMFFGGLLTWVVLPTATAGDGGSANGTTLEAMIDAQRQTDVALRELSAAVTALSSANGGAPVREAADGSASDLAAQLDRVVEALERLASRSAAGPGTAGRAPLVNPDRVTNHAALESLGTRDKLDVDLRHLGWTYQQVLDVYGRPTENYPDQRAVDHRWIYELPGGQKYMFQFVDGHVVRVLD